MHMIPIIGLAIGTFGLAVTNVIDQVPGLIGAGQTLSSLGVPALLGVIAIVSVIGLIKVFLIYKQTSEENSKALQELIKSNTVAVTKLADSVDDQSKSIDRMDKTVSMCQNKH